MKPTAILPAKNLGSKRKADPPRMQTILYVTAEVLRIIAIMTQPFLPASMEKLLGLLGVPAHARNFVDAEAAQGLVPGTVLPAPTPVFPRYIDAEEVVLPRGLAVLIDSRFKCSTRRS